MLTQVMGLVFARPHTWRLVLLTSTVLSGIQLLLSSRMYESPVRLNALGNKAGAEQVAKRLWHGLPPREGTHFLIPSTTPISYPYESRRRRGSSPSR
jgi:hypothetical protein